MLDRKTKNFNASVELLEDRKKWINYFNIFLLVMAVLNAVVFLISTSLEEVMLPPLIMSFALFILMFIQVNEQHQYDILIYLKQNEKKDVVYIKRKEKK